ncbi:hypothetical protein [Bacillus thuringiensis]|uniref:hypothetical protein n=1 Tax=Bacillus thuringiensis TaxID=1428 RepID=UPI0021D649AA|nr:hypothetical protein [Bacillus thuringiensis]MCU7667486.1 hypothetical protein [Bacillus thuringiensis]
MKNSFETIKNALTQHGTFAVEGEHGIINEHFGKLYHLILCLFSPMKRPHSLILLCHIYYIEINGTGK